MTAERALDLMRGLVLEDGRRWGDAAQRWQLDDAAAILDEHGPRYHYLTRPRGGSKTTDLAGVAIAWALELAPPGSRAYVVAVDAEQAGELLDAARGLITRTPGLAGAVVVESQRLLVPGTDVQVRVLAADAAGAFGRRPALTVVDEAAAFPNTPSARLLWTAITSAVIKGKGRGRLVVMTTAGDPAHRSHKLLEHARRSSMWRVSEVLGPLPWADPGDLDEQRQLLTSWEFDRLHLNRWTAADDRLVDLGDLSACVVLDGPLPPRPGVRYSAALDIGLKSDRTVLAVAHAEMADGQQRIVLDRLAVWQGSRDRPVALAEVEAACVEVWESYGRPALQLDPWQGVHLAQRLRSRGVRVVEFTFSSASVGRLARVLHTLLRDRRIALPDDAELLDELANVRLRESAAGVLRLAHDPGRHDDRAVALALAALPLVTRPSGVGTVEVAQGRIPTRRSGGSTAERVLAELGGGGAGGGVVPTGSAGAVWRRR